MAADPMWRVDMTFEEDCPPGHDTSYVRAKLASKAVSLIRKVHQNDFGGMKTAVAKKVKGQPDPPEPEPPALTEEEDVEEEWEIF